MLHQWVLGALEQGFASSSEAGLFCMEQTFSRLQPALQSLPLAALMMFYPSIHWSRDQNSGSPLPLLFRGHSTALFPAG